MTTGNWINLIAAILVGGGTLFLGIMALRTIRQTRSIQNNEKRESLLSEIIEWAENVGKCGIKPDIELHKYYQDAELDSEAETERDGKSEEQIAAETRHRQQLLSPILRYSKRNKYMSLITPRLGEKLNNAMRAVVNNLEEQTELLRESLLDIEHTSTTKIGLQMVKITESTDSLIEEVTKIKSKEIGGEGGGSMSKGDAVTESNEPTIKDIKDIEEHLKRQERQTKW